MNSAEGRAISIVTSHCNDLDVFESMRAFFSNANIATVLYERLDGLLEPPRSPSTYHCTKQMNNQNSSDMSWSRRASIAAAVETHRIESDTTPASPNKLQGESTTETAAHRVDNGQQSSPTNSIFSKSSSVKPMVVPFELSPALLSPSAALASPATPVAERALQGHWAPDDSDSSSAAERSDDDSSDSESDSMEDRSQGTAQATAQMMSEEIIHSPNKRIAARMQGASTSSPSRSVLRALLQARSLASPSPRSARQVEAVSPVVLNN